MAKRKEALTEPYRSQLLDELGSVKRMLHTYQDRLAPSCDDFETIGDVRRSIDSLAEKLTANPEYYHAANHKM